MAEVQTPAGASAKDTALVTLVDPRLLGGIVAFYWYDDQAAAASQSAWSLPAWRRPPVSSWFSWYGREFRQFAQAARVELRKVVWPEREETIQDHVVVFIFAAL